jgi:hypothetical protein
MKAGRTGEPDNVPGSCSNNFLFWRKFRHCIILYGACHTRLNYIPIWFITLSLLTKRILQVCGIDRFNRVIPIRAVESPKSFIIILVLVVWVYSMMGGNRLVRRKDSLLCN